MFEKTNIYSIDFSDNKLTNIQVGQINIPNLRELIIKNNQIYYLAPGCFHKNLQILNLEHNYISDISQDIFNHLPKLKDLNLRHNKIKTIDQINLRSLEKLDLSHNEIDTIESEAFADVPKLKELNLGFNNLLWLSYRMFPEEGSSLVILQIHANKFSNLDSDVIERLRNLREISYVGNPWSCHCLFNFEKYLKERHINQSACEKLFWKSGNYPVCINSEIKSCENKNIVYDVEDYKSFLETLKRFVC